MFRNEGSRFKSRQLHKRPSQGDLWSATPLAGFAILLSYAPQAPPKTLPLKHLFSCERVSMMTGCAPCLISCPGSTHAHRETDVSQALKKLQWWRVLDA